MFNVLYYIIIYPIELLLEACFTIINNISENPGIAIIGVSIVINFLLLPLYRNADRIQAEERKKQEGMKKWVESIRSNFKGDERVMMLSAYYRKQDYHPLYSLRSSISLLLQIPFFIAAYHFLSNLSILNGTSFLCINNLGQPDGLIRFGGVVINLLPVLMTVINCIAALIYTKGTPIKDNIQIYVLAGLFLILLYRSPSGLVLYWTMNNVFSLIKNIVLKEPAEASEKGKAKDESEPLKFLYWGAVVSLTVLIGLLIPSALVAASPVEFVEPSAFRSPTSFVSSTLCIAAGLFLCWVSVFYVLAPIKGKRRMCLALWLVTGIASIDYFLFAKNPGKISPDLVYDNFPVFTADKILIQLACLALACVVMILVWKKKQGIINGIYTVLIVSLMIMSVMNISSINKDIRETDFSEFYSAEDLDFPMSKNGKNVIVIMLDMAVSGYVPYIMAERPELMEKFDGFTYYPNTISFGMHTNFGAPALYGGYEYSPVAMNKRSDMTLVDKHDEALFMLPVLFSNAGYKATVIDPPYAKYKVWPDLRIFEPYPEIKTFHARSHFTDKDYYETIESVRRRSFFMYSLVRISPKLIQTSIYDDGRYLRADELGDLSWELETAYGVLKNMANMTDISDSDENTFMILDNDTAHEPTELQLPDYELSIDVSNSGLEKGYRIDENGNKLTIDKNFQYHPNAAALLRLGEWFDYLRENDVYDNTRIIIVADHGEPVGDFPELIMDDGTDMEGANPIFMFKDFDSKGYKVSDEFMTNADAPILAVKDVIDDPVNPFTGGKLDGHEKETEPQYVTASHYWSSIEPPNTADAYRFTTDDEPWYTVHDNIFDKSNWSVVPEP